MTARAQPPSRRRVAIVYRYVPQYRAEFYEGLRAELDRRAVDLSLVHGDPTGADVGKNDAIGFPWATKIHNRSVSVAGKTLVWQPVWRHVAGHDLVIVEQATKLASNYLLLLSQRVGGPRVALWGHGVNLQADERLVTRLAEAVKRRYTRLPHWFFAYTERGAARVRAMGLAADRITVVDNAIDTSALLHDARSVSEAELTAARRRLGVRGAHVGLYVGALYQEKRVPFLVESAIHIRKLVPDFELLVVGTGPAADFVSAAASSHDWVKWLGPVFGREKAVLGRLAKVLLMPGAVGLVVLDSFAMGIPLITTDVHYHGPEIDYVEDGVNGVVLPASADAATFAAGVAGLLASDERLADLRTGCARTVDRYTVENMIQRFADGICDALDRASKKGTPCAQS
jgi:glycosyltransferase involved in cell wall biosynthesis